MSSLFIRIQKIKIDKSNYYFIIYLFFVARLVKILTGQVIILTTEKFLNIEPWAIFSAPFYSFPARQLAITKSNAVTRLYRLTKANMPENEIFRSFGYKMTSSKTEFKNKKYKNIKSI